jgi:glycosyltransferase involved in cell wall biosynthesis
MNVLFVNNFRGRGGGEEFLRELLPDLVRKGVKVGLVCRPGTPLEDMFRDSGIAVHPTSRSGSAAMTSVFRIAGIIRDGSYDIVNIQRGHDILQSWSAARLSGRRPTLLYTPQVPEFLKSRFLLGRMHGIVTISRFIKDKLVEYYPALAKRITIIYYGIDLGKFKPGSVQAGNLRSRFGLVPETPVIGTVGDLWKNQIEFLDVLALIRKEFPDARFGLVASESGIGQVQAFKDRAEKLGLTDAVLWTGRLSKDEMLSFYADIDVAVSTHRNEGFGIWVLEALAMGKPAVAFNAGGIRDSLENCPAGVLVNGGAEEMAAGVIAILRDSARRKRMADEGPRWTRERFGTERMVEDYLRFFETIVDRREHGA